MEKKINKQTNILFVCKWNRFRSRVAEAYFNKINKDKISIKVKSAGLIQGSSPLNSTQVRAAKELGIKLRGRPQGISTKLLQWLDIMVIVADDVPSNLFDNEKYGKKTIRWDIRDVQDGSDIENNKKVIKLIIPKVRELVEQLNKTKLKKR